MSTTLYRYQPVVTTGPFGTDHRVSNSSDVTNIITDLADLDGWRYVAVPDDVTPIIPDVITTWESVILTEELREQIKAASPHYQLIAEQVIKKIRDKYNIDTELYIARIAVGALRGTYTLQAGESDLIAQYQIDVETAREWGRQQRANLGL